MSRKLLILIFIVTGLCLMVFANGGRDIYSLDQKDKGKADNKLIIAHTEIFGTLERAQVIFDHGRHSKAFKKDGCKICHPATEEENLIFEHPFKIVVRDKKSVMNSYHEKCIGCHKKRINERKKAGPITCGDCHVKDFESAKIEYPIFEFDFYYHEEHVKKLKEDCILCHHTYDKDDKELVYEKGTEQSCYYCHDNQDRRGSSLAVETSVTFEKELTVRKISHSRCLNCHIDHNERGLKAGPLLCSKCHTGKYRTLAELSRVTRPDRDQPDKPFINIENARMKGVFFDHRFHEKNTRTCRACHHETLKACKKCHGLIGSPEGKWVNVANSYHDVLSEIGCAGCHKIKKSEKNCAGCHHHLLDMDLQTKGPKRGICNICHSGKKENLIDIKPIPVSELNAEKVPEKVTIKVLEREYEPSIFPHRKIIEKLLKVSNESKMATYFHRNLETICTGCHHRSQAEAEAEKNKPPFCRNCHSMSFDRQNLNKPRLLAVYHRQCMGCHEMMNIKRGCADCHKEKTVRPANILSKNNELSLSGVTMYQVCHSALDAESRFFVFLWIPASAGMTEFT
ncbi:MAG: sulfate respiration complex hexadecaheme cytochrome HmcA [Nitrospirota bacterium]